MPLSMIGVAGSRRLLLTTSVRPGHGERTIGNGRGRRNGRQRRGAESLSRRLPPIFVRAVGSLHTIILAPDRGQQPAGDPSQCGIAAGDLEGPPSVSRRQISWASSGVETGRIRGLVIFPMRSLECVNNSTVPPILMAMYAREQTPLLPWTTLVYGQTTKPLLAGRPMNDRRLSVHGLGPIWFDLSAIVALLIAIGAVASWVAAFVIMF